MPTIYDNIEQHLLDALRVTLQDAGSADCCVGYFNLRGWGRLAAIVASRFDGSDDGCIRVLVGMHRAPEEEMRLAQGAARKETPLDGPTASRLRLRAAESFKKQLEFGIPTTEAERALQHLAHQLRARQVRVKLFLRYPLHAKLYLVHRSDPIAPLVAYLGSSNLTQAGLSGQGELNVDVLEQDAARKLQRWFDERWNDSFAFDISDELAALIEASWAREELVAPYLVYLKMIYHLAEEARQGEREFKLPPEFQGVMLDFQARAVSLAAHHLHRRGGVMLGDVVGLGKTLMATAIARIFQEDEGFNTLILCPPKLTSMWQEYVERYGLIARVMSIGKVLSELPERTIRYRLVIIDESHNLRNREGRRYRAIGEYIERNDSRCLLLTATPYNKQFTDIGNQLRLFIDEERDLGLRPEQFFQAWGTQGYNEADFIARYQASPRSLRAFEQSPFPDDWRDLMRLFLVRRTRRFIMANYAQYEAERQRHYVLLGDQPSYFPLRQPRKLTFVLDDSDPDDQYARLYRESVVDVIQDLSLPRYGLANYLHPGADKRAGTDERRILNNLNRAGRRLIGFCRTNLFKRLESSGSSFLLSLRRHILRNIVTLHALENGLPVPIGTQDAAMLDTAISDADLEWADEDGLAEGGTAADEAFGVADEGLEAYRARAAQVYQAYQTQYQNRFAWLDPRFFRAGLRRDLLADAEALLNLVVMAGSWDPQRDAKLDALRTLITEAHGSDKVLVFTQFADTARYLAQQLQQRGVTDLAVATSEAADPTNLAQRFSPRSNEYPFKAGETELRVLIATDVLAEGQNLQDCAVVVNYDLPWAIVRLIQRAGRVDRIGQQHDTILVYVFEPVEGVEHIIRLRARLSQRLQENQEVIGTDESFFGEEIADKLRDLYTEKASVLDEDDDQDVDLASVALQVWNSASEEARRQAERLPPVVYATRAHTPAPDDPAGALAYLRFPDGVDALVRVDEEGNVVSQSMTTILRTAACAPEMPALPRRPDHHDLTAQAVERAVAEVTHLGGQLGSLRSTRRKVYERLKTYREALRQTGQDTSDLDRAFDALFRFPLTRPARDALTRQLRLGITDPGLARMAINLYDDERLVRISEERPTPEPTIVCSLGLKTDASQANAPKSRSRGFSRQFGPSTG
ncbi:MAG: helicase-related protein [Anaerolineae bacterium]